MFFRKKPRETEKEILSSFGKRGNSVNDDDGIIEVKINSKEQLFSAYSYSDDKLNAEFCDYVYEKARCSPLADELTVKIYTDEEISDDVVKNTLKKHYGEEYLSVKREHKRVTTISLIMTLFGILTLALMVLLNHFWDNFYVSTIVEIAAWVFVWEAVDYFFLQRPVIKGKMLVIQKLYTAKTQICSPALAENESDERNEANAKSDSQA